MPMRSVTLRFPESLWRLVEQQAREEGLSASAFVRESVLAVVLIRAAWRDTRVGPNWERARLEARELLEE